MTFDVAAMSRGAGCPWTGACPGCLPALWLLAVPKQQLVLGN